MNASNPNNPTITILGSYQSRNIETKRGPRTVHYQPSRFDHVDTRFKMEFEIGSERDEVPVGTVYEWDVASDIVQGPYGPELGRNRTYVRRQAVPVAVAAKG